jgi:hypothetical protein
MPRLALPSLSLLALLLACGDTTSSPVQPEPTGSSSSSGGGAPTGGGGQGGDASTSGTGGNGGNGGSGGDGGAGGAGPQPLPPQCNIVPGDITICIENGSGFPGETVALDVHVLAPQGCTTFVQATASFESLTFDLDNMQDDNGQAGICNRRLLCTICNPPLFDWAELPAGAIGGTLCPDDFPVGLRDTLDVIIPAATPPGDYVLPMGNGNVISMQAACGGTPIQGFYESTNLMAPTIRVF